MPLATNAGKAQSTPAAGTALALPKMGAASSSKPKHASNRSQMRLAGSISRLIATGSGSSTPVPSDGAGRAEACPSSIELGAVDSMCWDDACVGPEGEVTAEPDCRGGSGSGKRCCWVGRSAGPTCLRIAFSLTPSRRAISRLLRPSALSFSMTHRRLRGIRRRPDRHPDRVASAVIPPSA
jgi:hypothetical protein